MEQDMIFPCFLVPVSSVFSVSGSVWKNFLKEKLLGPVIPRISYPVSPSVWCNNRHLILHGQRHMREKTLEIYVCATKRFWVKKEDNVDKCINFYIQWYFWNWGLLRINIVIWWLMLLPYFEWIKHWWYSH